MQERDLVFTIGKNPTDNDGYTIPHLTGWGWNGIVIYFGEKKIMLIIVERND